MRKRKRRAPNRPDVRPLDQRERTLDPRRGLIVATTTTIITEKNNQLLIEGIC